MVSATGVYNVVYTCSHSFLFWFRCWQYVFHAGAQVVSRTWGVIQALETRGNPPSLGVATRAQALPQPTPAQSPADRCGTALSWICHAMLLSFLAACFCDGSVQASTCMWRRVRDGSHSQYVRDLQYKSPGCMLVLTSASSTGHLIRQKC